MNQSVYQARYRVPHFAAELNERLKMNLNKIYLRPYVAIHVCLSTRAYSEVYFYIAELSETSLLSAAPLTLSDREVFIRSERLSPNRRRHHRRQLASCLVGVGGCSVSEKDNCREMSWEWTFFRSLSYLRSFEELATTSTASARKRFLQTTAGVGRGGYRVTWSEKTEKPKDRLKNKFKVIFECHNSYCEPSGQKTALQNHHKFYAFTWKCIEVIAWVSNLLQYSGSLVCTPTIQSFTTIKSKLTEHGKDSNN